MRDNTSLVLFLLALLLILALLVWRSSPVGESSPPQVTIEDAEAVPYVP